ncbi:hypothetical protein C2E23DRAFT_898780 [Lenzites betulinus]|nr:hypothetical protein C2E23DRAFT_898780 [Lenzites betulinus]
MSRAGMKTSHPKVFEASVDGTAIQLPRQGEDEAQLVGSPSKKRPADNLESPAPQQKKARHADASQRIHRERQRYQELKDDPLCHVSPTDGQSVQCDRCGSQIKLSDKNNFDQQHWNKHRKLCVRRPDAQVAAMRAKSTLGHHKMSCTPELTEDSASERTGTSIALTSEPPESRPASPVPASAPTPAPVPASASSPPLEADQCQGSKYLTHQSACRDYMAFAHPDATAYAPKYANYQEVIDDMKAWTPERSRCPVWCVDSDCAKLTLRRDVRWPSDLSEHESGNEDDE